MKQSRATKNVSFRLLVFFVMAVTFVGAENLEPISPETQFEEGLKYENLEKWTDAIKAYSTVAASNHRLSETAIKRLIVVLDHIKKEEGDNSSYEALISLDVKDKMKSRVSKSDQLLSIFDIDLSVTGKLTIVVLFLASVALILMSRDSLKVRRSKKILKVESMNQFPEESVSVPQNEAAKIPAFVHENTRIKIRELMDTIPVDGTRRSDQKVDIEKLESSELMSQLAKDFVSEVQIDDVKGLKFSHLMIQADLIFDDKTDEKTSGLPPKAPG